MKIRNTFILVSLLFVISLSGCGKENISISEDYATATVSSVKMDLASWQLKIMASSDADIHVSFHGTVSAKQSKSASELQDGTLSIQQSDSGEQAQDQIALGKKGQIMLCLPVDCSIPMKL